MKIKNTTSFPDYFLRRMVAWCCREIGLKPSKLRNVSLTYISGMWRGYGGPKGIELYIGRDSQHGYPVKDDRPGSMHTLQDQTEALVVLAAHECEHVLQFREGRIVKYDRGLEQRTRASASRVLESFRAKREKLLAQWNEQTPAMAATKPPKPTAVQKRAAHAAKMLAQWARARPWSSARR